MVKYADTEKEHQARRMRKAMQQFAQINISPFFGAGHGFYQVTLEKFIYVNNYLYNQKIFTGQNFHQVPYSWNDFSPVQSHYCTDH